MGRCVFGIGNPGFEYAKTRHNVGFAVLDALARLENVAFRKASDDAMIATVGDLTLIKPLTYVNRCGGVAARWAEESADGLLVVVDDVNLPVGRMRLKGAGSAGGHNGLRNIERALGTNAYARLRLGVGAVPPGCDLVDHVLGRFEADEASRIAEVVARAAEAGQEYGKGAALTALMGRYNRDFVASDECETE